MGGGDRQIRGVVLESTYGAPRRVAVAAALLVVLAAGTAHGRRADDPALDRVSSHLRDAQAQMLRRQAAGGALDLTAESAIVELRFDSLTPATVERLTALGAQVQHVSLRYGRVLAAVPLDRLAELATLPGLATIHPAYGAAQHAGVVSGQGDAPVRGEAARAHFGVDGTGTRIGILSDSFNRRIHGIVDGAGCERLLRDSSSQTSGDLPDTVVMINDGLPRSSDEGAALGEIIHDIAPGASLLFASAFPTEAAFAESIDALAACGSDVLVDDILFFAEPMFQDGIVAQAAQAAVDGGAAFFSAAGNNGRGGIDATYSDINPERDDDAEVPSGDDFHAFAPGRAFAPVTIPGACGVRVILQWDDPFSAGLGAGASADLDLYVLSAENPTAILATGTDSQGCSRSDGGPGGDPLEIATYSNHSGRPQTVYVAVDHFCGRRDLRFRIVTFATCRDVLSFDTAIFTGPQIYGHIAADGVTAVAGVFFGNAEGDGSAVHVEPFSARGGDIPFAFDSHGQPLPGGIVTRFKPELSAPDGVNTTFFGADTPLDDDTLPNFFGTSAAAPHAAAVAALLHQALPDLSAAQIVATLRASARDIEAAGRDDVSGDGLIDAYAALESVLAAPTPTATPVPSPGDCDGDGHVTIDELVTAVRIALDSAPLGDCPAADRDGDGRVAIDELITAVRAALT